MQLPMIANLHPKKSHFRPNRQKERTLPAERKSMPDYLSYVQLNKSQSICSSDETLLKTNKNSTNHPVRLLMTTDGDGLVVEREKSPSYGKYQNFGHKIKSQTENGCLNPLDLQKAHPLFKQFGIQTISMIVTRS